MVDLVTCSRRLVCFKVLFRVSVLSLIFFVSTVCLAKQDPEYAAVCENCSNQEDFARMAVAQVPDPAFGDALLHVYPVYIVNPVRSQVEFFNVHVQRHEGGISPYSIARYSSGVDKTAYPSEGDPVIASAVLNAALIADTFVWSLNDDLIADEFTHIESAVDLIGPFDSRAGYLRNQLAMDINAHYNSLWSRLVVNFSDMTSRLAGRFFGTDSVFDLDRFLVVRFADGTTIRVRIDNILEATDADDSFAFEMTVQQHTALLPDGTLIPQSGSHFRGFSWFDDSGQSNLAQRLARLAAIFGLEVGEPGGALDCTMTCDGPSQCRLDCRL